MRGIYLVSYTYIRCNIIHHRKLFFYSIINVWLYLMQSTQQMIYFIYATETYIMHFLEPTWFLNAPDLAGRKVNVLYDPGLAQRPPPLHTRAIKWSVWAMKQPLCSHLHKITNEPVCLYGSCPLWFCCRAKTLLRQLEGAGPENLDFFGAKWQLAALIAISGLKKVSIFRARPFQFLT